MSVQRGKDVLLKIQDNASNYVTVAGLRSRRIQLSSSTVDITDSASSGRWRELLDGAGLRQASISGSGVFKDENSDELVRTTFFADIIRRWHIIIPEAGTLEGLFQIVSLDYLGDHDRELTFDIALESAGELRITEGSDG